MELENLSKRRKELADLLLAKRNLDGFWEGRLSSSALGVAVAITAMHFDDAVRHKDSMERGVEWLVKNRNSDGGFGDSPESLSNISTSLLVFAALNIQDNAIPGILQARENLSGYLNRHGIDVNSASVADAILAHYKTDYTFSVPILVMCALCGIPSGDAFLKIPRLPFELALLPRSFYRVLKLSVVSYAIPALIAVGIAIFHHKQKRNPLVTRLRRRAIAPSLRLLQTLMPESGGFLEAIPLTAFVSMCLIASGHRDLNVVEKGIGFLKRTQREDGSWPIDIDLSTWVTTLSVKALQYPVLNIPGQAGRADDAGSMQDGGIADKKDHAGSLKDAGITDTMDHAGSRLDAEITDEDHSGSLKDTGITDEDHVGSLKDAGITDTKDHFGSLQDAEITDSKDHAGSWQDAEITDEDHSGSLPDAGITDTKDYAGSMLDNGVADDGLPLRALDRERLTDHILRLQYTSVHPFNGAMPGGWGWTHHAGSVPDGDDTPGAIIALLLLNRHQPEKVIDAVVAGCDWLLNLRNSDGGFPTFVRGWGKLPFDQSCADLTGHGVLAMSLALENYPSSLGLSRAKKIRNAIRQGISYLQKNQRSDGALLPLWFGNQQATGHLNPVYGTARVLTYLNDMAGLPVLCDAVKMRIAEVTERGRSYLRKAQNPDGSWGGDAGVPGTMEETALALGALAGKDDLASCSRAVRWLDQQYSGRGLVASPIGLYFASLWYDEDLYPLTAYLEGISRVIRVTG
jgi:prenyltransferase beta subunit